MSRIDDAVRRFLLTSVPSVPFLEAALLMRERQGQRHTAAEVAARLYIAPRDAGDILAALCDAGIVRADAQGCAYAPRDEALASMMDRVAAAYHADLVGVATLIHDATGRNARRFADAFRLKKEA